jgi:hypothetical protein
MLHVGLHHAREWPSGELPIEFAFDLVRNERSDPRIGALLDRVRVVVVPVVNPDGFTASREAPADTQDPVASQLAGLVQNGTSYRRKNCRAAGESGLTQPPTPCEGAPASTSTATTRSTGAATARRPSSPPPTSAAPGRSPSPSPRRSAGWSPAVR